MNIKFNNKDNTIRQNEDGLYSLTDIEKAWLAEGGTGGQLRHWKDTPEVHDMLLSSEIRIISTRGRNGETWGCEEAVIEYASYCSNDFRRAVRKAFIELTKGNVYKAAAIAESVAVSPELLDKYEKARQEMNDTIKEFGGSMGSHAFSNYHRLACKGATGYVPSVLTGKNGSTKDYLAEAECPEALTAVIAAMELVSKGLKAGLDYHTSAFMLNVKTTKNGEFFA
ncbi:KilA-N domain-containing protein [Aeromonas veronii]|uniref:KilA-N domain-containing protein n=1 Tax=Aeromonas veronii TaxID=654 RepID=UPI001F421B4A|nr:KilA-N domain-containing protein [Aeromonas veronii]MCF5866727.1 KilA-N domain-containing protein [Aeromonas veronii]